MWHTRCRSLTFSKKRERNVRNNRGDLTYCCKCWNQARRTSKLSSCYGIGRHPAATSRRSSGKSRCCCHCRSRTSPHKLRTCGRCCGERCREDSWPCRSGQRRWRNARWDKVKHTASQTETAGRCSPRIVSQPVQSSEHRHCCTLRPVSNRPRSSRTRANPPVGVFVVTVWTVNDAAGGQQVEEAAVGAAAAVCGAGTDTCRTAPIARCRWSARQQSGPRTKRRHSNLQRPN